MRNTLTIAGLGRVVRGTPTPADRFGAFVKPEGMQGWEGLPAGRREALARQLSHGEHDVPVKLPARVITIDMWLIGRTLSDLREISQQITSWGATGDRFTLTVEHQEQTLHAKVRRILAEADDKGVRHGGHFRAAAQAQFLAADPRKYGELLTLPASGPSTSIQVYHHGTFPAHVIVEIPSAPSSYTVTSPAGTFTVTGATSGGTHRIDMRTGRVTRNGSWMPTAGSGRLWAVPEGEVWTHTLSAPGRVLIADTYV